MSITSIVSVTEKYWSNDIPDVQQFSNMIGLDAANTMLALLE